MEVILNILENAMQHAKGMTTLKFTVSQCGDMVSFEIEDDGCGIPDQIRRSLFKETIENGEHTDGMQKSYKPIDGRRYHMGIGMYVCVAIIDINVFP